MVGNRMRAFALWTAFAIICSAPPASAAQFDGRWRIVVLTTQRPLRRNPYRRWNKPWPNLFYWQKLFRNAFRSLPDSVGRSRFRLRAGPDECSGWPAHRPWDRTVQSVSGQRDVGRYWAFRSLLGRLDRRSEDETFVVEDEEEILGTYHLRPNWGRRCTSSEHWLHAFIASPVAGALDVKASFAGSCKLRLGNRKPVGPRSQFHQK